ncbi:hypothetical protein LTS07_011381 [Exophiala sideris]|nr:hypothetical protein LTS07_011381 [Exophiala sideris]KAK5023004.1 hypothetical protein LTR13_011350 [Exophiala sideris]KAK5176085.1 hypothetical protein LTR44_011360 [Eurotiomycetes sp. CCFEE 6388]
MAGKGRRFEYHFTHISHTGEFKISKKPGKDGEVSVETLTSQLVYEIQGIRGLPPPPNTKVGITAFGGYRAEYHVYLTSLYIEEKAAMVKAQAIAAMRPEMYRKFMLLKFHIAGSPNPDARTQDAATVDLRIFAQTDDPELLGPEKFLLWCKMEQHPARSVVDERVHLHNGEIISFPSADVTKTYPTQQKSYDPDMAQSDQWGPTVRTPLGSIVLGRSGDKSSDANLGLFVRHDDEWDWLRSTFTLAKLKELLADDYAGKPINRFELPNLRAVHFLLHDHLDRGYNARAGLDCLGKKLVEYIRAKIIDVPERFLKRGRI